jgi:hypothetical protein
LDAEICAAFADRRAKVPAGTVRVADSRQETARQRNNTAALDTAKLPGKALSAGDHQEQQLERNFRSKAAAIISHNLQESSRLVDAGGFVINFRR